MIVASQRYSYSGFRGTAADTKAYNRISTRGKAIVRYAASPAPTLKQRLADALAQAKSLASEGVRYLGTDRAKDFRTRLTELLNPEDWEDGDVVLREASTRTMIRTAIAVDAPTGGLTLTAAGNLVCTWHDGERKVRVEALPNGYVSWAIIKRVGEELVPNHKVADTINGFQAALQA